VIGVTVEKASGNRTFDESIKPALRAAEPLPPIPAGLNADFVELGFRFKPEKGEEQSKN